MNNLSNTTDISLITNVIDNNCSDSLLELCKRNDKIFASGVYKYAKHIHNSGKDPQEILNQKMMIIYECCKSYNPKKSTKFSTWVAYRTRFKCLNFMNRDKPLISLDSLADSGVQLVYSKPHRINEEGFMKILNKHENKLEAEICKKRYFFDSKRRPTWKSIGRELNLDEEKVVKIHNKALKSLRKKV